MGVPNGSYQGDEVLVLRAAPYDFLNPEGQQVQGLKIHYANGQDSGGTNVLGWDIYEDSLPYAARLNLRDVPGIYSTLVRQVRGKDNRPVLRISGLQFVRSVDTDALFLGADLPDAGA